MWYLVLHYIFPSLTLFPLVAFPSAFILSLLGKEKIFRKFHQITCAALMSAEEIGVKSRKSQKMNGSLS